MKMEKKCMFHFIFNLILAVIMAMSVLQIG